MEPTQAIATAGQTALETAAERDRLKALNAEMLAALKGIMDVGDKWESALAWQKVEEAIANAKAEGRK